MNRSACDSFGSELFLAPPVFFFFTPFLAAFFLGIVPGDAEPVQVNIGDRSDVTTPRHQRQRIRGGGRTGGMLLSKPVQSAAIAGRRMMSRVAVKCRSKDLS